MSKGVYQVKTGKWTAKISRNGRYIHVGTFDTEAEAQDARDEAEAEYPPTTPAWARGMQFVRGYHEGNAE